MPNLLIPGGLKSFHSEMDEKSNSTAETGRSMEVMMIKRLNFLRNSLDTHNPKETTVRLRQNAARKRDERILELWRKD